MRLYIYTKLTFLKLLPKNLLSHTVGKIAEIRFPSWFLRPIIKIFVWLYKIDMSEVSQTSFACFNEFFARPLKEGARKVDDRENKIVSPVDGIVGAMGKIENGTLIQAKGISYPLEHLVGNKEYENLFQGGNYITIYLSPRHYHRIHSPVAATIEELYYIPGNLFPVNPFAVNNIPGLFTINERLISLLNHPTLGKIAVIKVGATIVGKIKVVYDDTESNLQKKIIHRKHDFSIGKGKEIGQFLFGSTVVLLFQDNMTFEQLQSGQSLLLGEAIGQSKT